MARRRRDEGEDEEQPKRKSRSGSSAPRMSVTIPAKALKRIKLAAALADLEVGEWCKVVLARAATRTVEKAFPSLAESDEEGE